MAELTISQENESQTFREGLDIPSVMYIEPGENGNDHKLLEFEVLYFCIKPYGSIHRGMDSQLLDHFGARPMGSHGWNFPPSDLFSG